MYRTRDGRLTLSQSFMCSAIAGFTSKTITAPFDVVKIRSQVGCAETKNGLLNSIITIYYKEGMHAFWKGNLIGCLRLCPYSAIQLIAFQNLRIPLCDSCGRLSPVSALVAGAGAGLIATTVMYPTDLVKTRLIVQHSGNRWAHYKGITHAFRTIVDKEGIISLYRGLSLSFMGTVPYTATMFLIYEALSKLNRKSELFRTPLSGFIEGCIASALAQGVSYPFDTIRKKMQAYSTYLPNKGGVDIPVTSASDAYRKITAMYGMRGLWSGLSANLLRIVPYTGLMFYMFETCKRYFLYYNGYTLSPFQQIHHPLVDQSLRPQEIVDDEDNEDWILSEED